MNKIVIREWVDALRSGEYEQGTGQLSRDGEYCCLGVLCELAHKKGLLDKDIDSLGSGNVIYTDGDDRDEMMPPVSIRRWAGIDDWTVEREDEDEDWVETELAVLNDDNGYSFDEIADLIERNYLTEVDA